MTVIHDMDDKAEPKMRASDVSVFYGDKKAIDDVLGVGIFVINRDNGCNFGSFGHNLNFLLALIFKNKLALRSVTLRPCEGPLLRTGVKFFALLRMTTLILKSNYTARVINYTLAS